MSAPRPAVPAPAELADRLILSALLDGYVSAADRLTRARHGGADVPRAEVASDALTALAHAHALALGAVRERWPLVCDALSLGVALVTIAAAMGLDADEVRAGLASWADDQRRRDLISDATHTGVLSLLARA